MEPLGVDKIESGDLVTLAQAMEAVANKWFGLGTMLEIPSKNLDKIKHTSRGSQQRALMAVLQEWLHTSSYPPTWQALISAVRSPMVGDAGLADVIAVLYHDKKQTATERYRPPTGSHPPFSPSHFTPITSPPLRSYEHLPTSRHTRSRAGDDGEDDEELVAIDKAAGLPPFSMPPLPMSGGPPLPMSGGPPLPMAGGPPLSMAGGPPLAMAGGPPLPLFSPPSPDQVYSLEPEKDPLLTRSSGYQQNSLKDSPKSPSKTIGSSWHPQWPPPKGIAVPQKKMSPRQPDRPPETLPQLPMHPPEPPRPLGRSTLHPSPPHPSRSTVLLSPPHPSRSNVLPSPPHPSRSTILLPSHPHHPVSPPVRPLQRQVTAPPRMSVASQQDDTVARKPPFTALRDSSSNEFHSAEEGDLSHVSYLEGPHRFTTQHPHSISPTSWATIYRPTLQTPQQRLLVAVTTKDIPVLETLLKEKEIDVNLRFEGERTILMLASIEGDVKILQCLLEHKPVVDATDQDGCTALHHASSSGNYDVTKELVKQLANVNAFTKDGSPMLLKPSAKGFSIIVEYLLQRGANPNDCNPEGVTPLIAAIRNGHKDVVVVLLNRGADPQTMTRDGYCTPMLEAVERDHTEIVALLTKAIAKATAKSHQLFKVKTAEGVGKLVEEGVRVDERRGDGVTPLMVAAEDGNVEVARKLLSHGANIDLQDNQGQSALMKAAHGGHDDMTQLLTANQAILDLKSKRGWTALMHAAHRGHEPVVRRLLLARADPSVMDRAGKTAVELAQDQDMRGVAGLLTTPTSSAATSSSDPFVKQISTRLRTEVGEPVAEAPTVPPSGGKKAEEGQASSALVRRRPEGVGVEREGTVKDELGKAWRRIAELETRIHDLTLQTTLEFTNDSDLSYLERSRLEAELRRTKELKKKAEQYAIEAKQTAQRLSAENFKLKEDLRREQHFNELTRKSLVTELEDTHTSQPRDKTGEEGVMVKKEEFERVVSSRARELVKVRGSGHRSQLRIARTEFTTSALKDVIQNKSVSVTMVQVGVGGLPNAGNSTLLDNILGIKESRHLHCRVAVTNSFLLFESVRISDTLSSRSFWIKSSEASPEVVAISTVLARMYAQGSSLPNLAEISSAVWGEGDPELDGYFRDTLTKVTAFLSKAESEGKLELLASTAVPCLVNWWDVNYTKVTYEIATILAGRCKSLLILPVLSLREHGLDLFKPLALPPPPSDQPPSGDVRMLLRILPAFHYYFRFIEHCAGLQHSALVVGTHSDQLEPSVLDEAKKKVFRSVKARAQEINIGPVLCPSLVSIDARSQEDCKKVWSVLEEMIAKNGRFKYDIPLRWLFLRYALFATKRIFILRSKVFEVAKMCGFHDNQELEECLSLFQSCGYMLYSDSGGSLIPSLFEYVTIDPVSFFHGLEELYYFEQRHATGTIKAKVQQSHIDRLKNGIITAKLAKAIWKEEHKIYLQILQDMSIVVSMEAIFETCTAGGRRERIGCYFMPSLRPDRYETPLSAQSTSLVITMTGGELPFQMQAGYVLYFQTHRQSTVKFVPNTVFNVTQFQWCDPLQPDKTADISVNYLVECAEIVISPNKALPSDQSSLVFETLCSIFKTATLEVCYKMSQFQPGLQYRLSIVCPASDSEPGSQVHLIPFHPLQVGAQTHVMCLTCRSSVAVPDERLCWIQAAYQGPKHQALHPNEVLSQSLLSELSSQLATLSPPLLEAFSSALSFSPSEVSSLQSSSTADLVLKLLVEWQRREAVCTKQQLAVLLHRCGQFKLAVKLDPTLFSAAPPLLPLPVTLTTLSTLSQCLPDWLALGRSLKVPRDSLEVISHLPAREKTLSVLRQWLEATVDVTDHRTRLFNALRTLGYFNLAEYVRLGLDELGVIN